VEKVRLTVDDLQVQSFATSEREVQRRGTVRAHDVVTDQFECPTQDQAWDTCWGTCGETCGCQENSQDTDWSRCTWGYWISMC
jgi:hypothetical protein